MFLSVRQFQGWITWFSWISLLASVTNICANVTTTIVSANYPNYSPTSWHTILIMWAYLFVFAMMNMYMFWIIVRALSCIDRPRNHALTLSAALD